MDRFTYRSEAICAPEPGKTPYDLVRRLADYEDTGLTPEEVKTAIRIAERIATADYPHNFQRERRDIVDYMYWITDVMRDAKAWWNGRIKDKGGT